MFAFCGPIAAGKVPAISLSPKCPSVVQDVSKHFWRPQDLDKSIGATVSRTTPVTWHTVQVPASIPTESGAPSVHPCFTLGTILNMGESARGFPRIYFQGYLRFIGQLGWQDTSNLTLAGIVFLSNILSFCGFQLAILATYMGDELVAVYRYFRSLAVEIPFSTARDNLIIIFDKVFVFFPMK